MFHATRNEQLKPSSSLSNVCFLHEATVLSAAQVVYSVHYRRSVRRCIGMQQQRSAQWDMVAFKLETGARVRANNAISMLIIIFRSRRQRTTTRTTTTLRQRGTEVHELPKVMAR